MSQFVPEEKEFFPTEEIIEKVITEGVAEEILAIAQEFIPTNFELLEDFIKNNSDGLCIKDLGESVDHIQSLILAIQRYGHKAKDLFDEFVEIAAKPLIETKSNEKLTTKGMENIEFFLTNLGELSINCPAPFKIKLLTTIRRIVNGGKNPSDLKPKSNNNNNNNNTVSMDLPTSSLLPQDSNTSRARVIDIEYMYDRVKQSKLIKYLVEEFTQAAKAMNYQSQSNNPTPTKSNHQLHNNNNANNTHTMTREEELAFYGVPIPNKKQQNKTNNTNKMDEEEREDTTTPTTATTISNANGTNGMLEPQPESNNNNNKAILRELTQLLLDICLDLSENNNDLAAMFCEYHLSDAIVMLLDKDYQHDPRDHRLSYLIELLWNILEAFVEKMRTQGIQSLQPLPLEEGIELEVTNPIATVPSFNLTEYLTTYETHHHQEIINLTIAIPILSQLFQFQLYDGFREIDKELRNEILIIFTLLSEFPYAIGQFIHYELLHIFITYACIEEMSDDEGNGWSFFHKPIANSRNFASQSDSDYEFKKQLWNLLSILLTSNDNDVILCIAASPLVTCMMNYLEYDLPTTNMNTTTNNNNNNSNMIVSSVLLDTLQQQSSIFSENPILLHTHLTTNNTNNNTNNTPLAGERSSFLDITNTTHTNKTPTTSHSHTNSHTNSYSKPNIAGGGSLILKPLSPSKPNTTMTTTMTNNNNTTTNTTNTNNNNTTTNTNTNNMTTTALKKKGYLSQLTPSKLKEFQIQSILFLFQNIPKMLFEFQRIDGIPRILSLLMKYILSEQEEHRMIVYYMILLLIKCILTNSHELSLLLLHEHAGIAICLYLFIHCSSSSSSSNNEKEDEIRSALVRMISLLCSANGTTNGTTNGNANGNANGNEYAQSQFISLQSISIFLPVLRHYITKQPAIIGMKAGMKIYKHIDILTNPYPDPLDNPYAGDINVLILTILHCFQCSIIGNMENELVFVEQEGLDCLLDLFEIAPMVLRIPVIRLLSNLLNNSLLLNFFHNWRSSKTFRSASQIICHAWLDEEIRVQSDRTSSKGIINNLFDPLGKQSWAIAPFEIPLVGMFAATTGEEILSQSVTVSKLATAILAGRNAIQTNLPIHICQKILESDIRVILADIIAKVGLYTIYSIESAMNPCKLQEENALSIIQEVNESTAASSPFVPSSLNHNHTNNNSNNNNNHSNHTSRAGTAGTAAGGNNSPNRRTQQSFTAENATSMTTGFEDGKLSPKELQVLSLAKKYLALREGEWWRKVQYAIKQQGILPIEADATLLDTRLELSFDAALATQLEQMQLYENEEQLKKNDENIFVDGIVTKMNQQIKAEWSKKMARGGGAKKTMKQQREQSQQSQR